MNSKPNRLILILFIMMVFVSHETATSQTGKITAAQLIERIKKHTGVPWNQQTVDVFKAGNPDVPVTGVVCTMFATYDVLEKAVAEGKNLIITHEPTFYNHLDNTADMEKAGDAVLAEKKAYIEKHGLVIWRFHDHWHMRNPDGIMEGMVKELQWEKYQVPGQEGMFTLPATDIDALARDLGKKLGISTIRIIGRPGMICTHVALMPGAPGSTGQISMLERKDVEALLIGESPEWETASYVRDAVAEGKNKALIVLGHVPSEEAGMKECARWLKTFVTEVPVVFISTGESYRPIQ